MQDQVPHDTAPKPAKPVTTGLLALGSNLASLAGGPREILDLAIDQLVHENVAIRAVSPFYHTPAFPEGSGPDFVNAAIVVDWSGGANDLLQVLHGIEAELGRQRSVRWGQRTLDIDLIGLGGMVLPDAQTHAHWRDLPMERQMREAPDQLILPHPRMQDRAFVLVPLADVAADWVHPILQRTVQQMLDDLPESAKHAVKRVE